MPVSAILEGVLSINRVVGKWGRGTGGEFGGQGFFTMVCRMSHEEGGGGVGGQKKFMIYANYKLNFKKAKFSLNAFTEISSRCTMREAVF